MMCTVPASGDDVYQLQVMMCTSCSVPHHLLFLILMFFTDQNKDQESALPVFETFLMLVLLVAALIVLILNLRETYHSNRRDDRPRNGAGEHQSSKGTIKMNLKENQRMLRQSENESDE